ncbi:protein LURP-one-related 17 [Apium graveolens]|uniref:protein LURP-one-related 17 n=1 Tax=Apium graveolens TaxID=4045 RepID=UPI003D79DC9E
MFPFLKTLSRTVHEVHEEHHEEDYLSDETSYKSLTVWRKSLVLSCNGFTVIDSDGDLVYRVDNYSGHPSEVILMDGCGNIKFTLCRRKKKLRLVDNWLIYQEGDNDNSSAISEKHPSFVARKQINHMLQQNANVLAHVYAETSSNKGLAYVIEGSYAHRSCKIYEKSRKVVAEIKRKEASMGGEGVSFGLDVFVLVIRPGFDQGMAMAIVLLLDQMFS